MKQDGMAKHTPPCFNHLASESNGTPNDALPSLSEQLPVFLYCHSYSQKQYFAKDNYNYKGQSHIHHKYNGNYKIQDYALL